MFADDTKCFKTITQPSDSTQLQHDLNSLCRWTTDSNLKFNPSKIFLLNFKSQNTSSTYTIGSSAIKQVSKHSDLGVILSSNLSWEPHYQHITSNAYKLLGLLHQNFSSDINCKKPLYIHIFDQVTLHVLFYHLETIPHKACTYA